MRRRLRRSCAALRKDSVTTAGEFWSLKDYVVEMKPLQRPHPPMWYAVGSPYSVVWPARNGVNVVCGGPVSRVRAISDRYREEAAAANLQGETAPLVGVNRYIIIGGTDHEAHDIGRKAWPAFYENFIKLWRKHGTEPVNAKLPPSFDQLARVGACGRGVGQDSGANPDGAGRAREA